MGCGYLGSERFGQPEIQNLDRAIVGDFHVRGLQGATNDATFVSVFKCFRKLLWDVESLVKLQGRTRGGTPWGAHADGQGKPCPYKAPRILSASVGPSTNSITNARNPPESSKP